MAIQNKYVSYPVLKYLLQPCEIQISNNNGCLIGESGPINQNVVSLKLYYHKESDR